MDDVTAAAPLLIGTAEEQILDDALRWCAAVGCTPDVAVDVAAVRRSWRSAAAILVGDDLAPALGRAGLPRRDHVLMLARDRDAAWADAVAIGAVDVVTPSDEARALDALTVALDGRGEACVVSVIGGCGGAGASTLAGALAVAGAGRGLRVLLLDADPLGGGIELLLGSEHVDGLRWADLGAGDVRGASGPVAAGALVGALPTHDGLSVLSWGRDGPTEVPDALDGVLAAATRGFDLVVADVPRHLDPPATDIIGTSVLTVVVVPEEVRAVGSARRVVAGLEPHTGSLAVVAAARPGGIGSDAVADALGRPVLARLGRDRHLARAVDHGFGPGRSRPARRVTTAVLDLLGLAPAGSVAS